MLRAKLAEAELDEPSRRARGIRRNMVDYQRSDERSLRWRDSESEALERLRQRLRGEADPHAEFRVLRQSVFTGRWTLYSGGGAVKKPDNYVSEDGPREPRAEEMLAHDASCPFCKGNEHRTPDSLLTVDAQGRMRIGPELPGDWQVRAIPNIFPLLVTPPGAYGKEFEKKLESIPHSGVARGRHQNEKAYFECGNFPQVDAIGFSELVIESPVHNGLLGIVGHEQIALSLWALQERGKVVREKRGMKQLLYFKQYGTFSGGSLLHPHFQLLGLPIVTPAFHNLLQRAIDHYGQKGMCNRCRWFGTEARREVYRSTHFVAVTPFAGREYSVAIIPFKHGHSWLDISREELEDLAFVLQLVMEALYHHLEDPSYDLFFKSLDCRETIQAWPPDMINAFHWTLEIQPRFASQIGGVELASGVRVGDRLPEDAASELRGAIEERLKVRQNTSTPTSYSNYLEEALGPPR